MVNRRGVPAKAIGYPARDVNGALFAKAAHPFLFGDDVDSGVLSDLVCCGGAVEQQLNGLGQDKVIDLSELAQGLDGHLEQPVEYWWFVVLGLGDLAVLIELGLAIVSEF